MFLVALLPMLVAVAAIVLDVVLIEFFGAFFIAMLSLLVYAGVGFLLALRLPRHPVGWLLLSAGALFQVDFAASAYAWAVYIRAPGTLPLGQVALLLGFAWEPALGCLFLAIMLFPTGRLPSRRWRVPLAFVVGMTVLLVAAAWLGLQAIPVPPSMGAVGTPALTVANPLAVDGPLGNLLQGVYGSAFGFLFTSFLLLPS